MLDQPIITVGIPCFNNEKHVRDAIESVLLQSIKNIEIIISDNASNDNTYNIVLEYQKIDERIRSFRQKNNIGAAKNFEFLLKSASGKFFIWLAADDMLSPKYLETLLSEITCEDLCIKGAVQYLNENIPGEMLYISEFRSLEYLKFFLEDDTKGRAMHIYGMFNREKLLNAKFSFLELDFIPDIIFVANLLALGNLRSTMKTFSYYRRHATNLGYTQTKKYLGISRIIYRVHPFKYYIYHYKYVFFDKSFPFLMVIFAVKHIRSQYGLWIRGVKKSLQMLKNIIR